MNMNPTPGAREMDVISKPSDPMNLAAQTRQAPGAGEAGAAPC
jgi:hypothetical protein